MNSGSHRWKGREDAARDPWPQTSCKALSRTAAPGRGRVCAGRPAALSEQSCGHRALAAASRE